MKKHPVLAIVGVILAVIIVFFAVINIIPPKKNVENNPFLVGKDGLPMIAAHRGGGANNPENTLRAFREAVHTVGVEILESDLYLTKDGYLVYNHDSYIDETCNINGDIPLEAVKALCEDKSNRHYIRDMTLEELRQYNFGYYFEDENGQRIYKNVTNFAQMGLQIATVDELFLEFYEGYPNLMFIVEIKNSGEDGKEACRILAETLEIFPGYKDQIVVGTFHDEIEAELEEHYPYLMRGASTGVARDFVLSTYAGVNLFNGSDFGCLQIPMSYDIGVEVRLDTKMLIKRAHRRGIAVQYWTVNDADDMRKLIELGVDCIMTDDPALMKQILDEYR